MTKRPTTARTKTPLRTLDNSQLTDVKGGLVLIYVIAVLIGT